MNARGATLIELLVALAAGTIVTGAVATLFEHAHASMQHDRRVADVQANLRLATEFLVTDIAHAGYLGRVPDPGSIELAPVLAAADLCGLTVLEPVRVEPACIGDEVAAGTDVVGVTRVASRAVSPDALDNGRVYLAENGVRGLVFAPSDNAPAFGESVVVHEFQPALYFIRNYSVERGDAIPTLCRKVLQGGIGTRVTTECLVEGIEDMTIQYPDSATAVHLRLVATSFDDGRGWAVRRTATTTVALRNVLR